MRLLFSGQFCCTGRSTNTVLNIVTKKAQAGILRPNPPSRHIRRQTRTTQTQCEPGHYCMGGSRLPCRAGTFGSTWGLSSPSCSGPCPAGYFCSAGLAMAFEGHRCGATSWYCPAGSGVRMMVGEGNFTVGESADRRVAQVMWHPQCMVHGT